MDKITFKKNALFLVVFSIILISIFSPIASNIYFPNSQEFANHLIGIFEGKKALLEGQFPIRVITANAIYPYFQFYSPLPYMVSGLLDIYFNNPLISYKVTMFFVLLFGGLYFFRFIKLFVNSEAAAFLGAVCYLTSPFLLVDLTARGDFTESFAIGLLPAVLYYSISVLREKYFYQFILCALFWCLLSLTHIITFIFSVLFIGFFLIVVTIFENITWKNLFYTALSLGFGCLLSLWYLLPIVLFHSNLYIHDGLINPAHTYWLTHLSTLLSPLAISPMPMPGSGKLHYPLHLSIGLIAIFAVCLSLFLLFTKKKTPYFISFSIIYYLGIFLLVWSPFDIWQFLPPILGVLQFSFRLMIHLMWISSLLFAWGIYELFNRKIGIKKITLILFIILFANTSWLMMSPSFPQTVSELISNPIFKEKSALQYSLDPKLINHSNQILSLISNCKNHHANIVCDLNVASESKWALPINYYPDLLKIKLDGKHTHYFPGISNQRNEIKENILFASVNLPAGHHTVEAGFIGLEYANELSLFCWIFVILFFVFKILIELFTFQKEDGELGTITFDKNGFDL